MAKLFWLSDQQWAAIEPLIPMHRRGVKPRRNRQVISGIIHVLQIGCRWEDCPREYGPHRTVCKRFNRWSKAGIWQTILSGLAVFDAVEVQSIDSTRSKPTAAGLAGQRLSWLSRIVPFFHGRTRVAAPRGWRCAHRPTLASALPRRDLLPAGVSITSTPSFMRFAKGFSSE